MSGTLVTRLSRARNGRDITTSPLSEALQIWVFLPVVQITPRYFLFYCILLELNTIRVIPGR